MTKPGRGSEIHVDLLIESLAGGVREHALLRHHEADPERSQEGTSVAGRTRQDLSERELEVFRPGTGERPPEVEHAGATSIGERVADRRVAGLQPPLRVSRGRREAVAAVAREPQHPERSLRRAAHDRPGRRDPLLGRADAPRPRHRRDGLQQESSPEDEREHSPGDLPQSEGLESERPR